METWVKAPFLQGAPILIIGECIQSAFPKLWDEFAKNRIALTSCPQADGFSGLTEKLATLIKCSNPKEITVLTVDGSPHCNMLHASANAASFLTGIDIPMKHLVVTQEGDATKISSESVRLSRYLHLVERCIQRCPDLIVDLGNLSLEQQNAEKRRAQCSMIHNKSGVQVTSDNRARFKAVLFDLGGTLIDTAPIPEIIRRILEAHGIQRSLSDIATAHSKTESQMSLEDYVMPYDEFWIKWNLGIIEGLKIKRDIRYLARVILEEWWDFADVKLYPDVEETLRYLRRHGLKTGIVTNGFKKDIDDIMFKVGFTGYFDVEVGVDAVGKPKPNREIFDFALDKLGVSNHETIFVGDMVETDYEGSARAGLFPVLIDRDDGNKEEIRKIRRLTQLVKYLQ